jgi:hypothetical protein
MPHATKHIRSVGSERGGEQRPGVAVGDWSDLSAVANQDNIKRRNASEIDTDPFVKEIFCFPPHLLPMITILRLQVELSISRKEKSVRPEAGNLTPAEAG